jgi:uncharacterized membrane protein
MTQTRTHVAGRIAWIAVAVWVLVYAPMAAEFMGRYFFHSPELWDHTFADISGHQQAYGPATIHTVQMERYRDNASVMVAHTMLGATVIALSVFQLSRLSRRKLNVHRWLGRGLVGGATVAMLAAMAFLLAVGPAGTYDGPAFNLQLWGLALGTLAGAWIGFYAIRKRQVATHRVMMLYMFALLCTAPFLRLGYLLFPLLWNDTTQAESNLVGAALLGFMAPSAVIVAARFVPSPGRLTDRDSAVPRRAEISAGAVGALGAFALGWAYIGTFHTVDRITACWVTAALLLCCVAVRNRLKTSTVTGRRDWSIYLMSIELALPLTAALWAGYRLAYSQEASYYGALLTGPPVTISLAVLAMAIDRWRPLLRNQRA